MTDTTAATSVSQTITVDARLDHAFRAYASYSWWNRDYHLLPAKPESFVVEQFEGGRVFERSADGEECDWGKVLVWEPPRRLVTSWAISPSWTPQPDPATASEVDVRFTADGPNRTIVELEHRHLDRHGDGWEQYRDAVSGEHGWAGLLTRFAAALP